jgi:hypothetical protein
VTIVLCCVFFVSFRRAEQLLPTRITTAYVFQQESVIEFELNFNAILSSSLRSWRPNAEGRIRLAESSEGNSPFRTRSSDSALDSGSDSEDEPLPAAALSDSNNRRKRFSPAGRWGKLFGGRPNRGRAGGGDLEERAGKILDLRPSLSLVAPPGRSPEANESGGNVTAGSRSGKTSLFGGESDSDAMELPQEFALPSASGSRIIEERMEESRDADEHGI